jgi:apolipoprotein N-acyltransferase
LLHAGASLRNARWSIGGAALVIVCAAGYGFIRLGQAASERIVAKSDGREFRVLAIQTNLPQSNKMAWLPQDQMNDFAEFYRQTVEAVDVAGKDGDRPLSLIIWPETMVPGYGLESQAIALTKERDLYPSDTYLLALQRLRELTGVPLLVGSPSYFGLRISDADRTYSWDAHHNSAYLIDGEMPYQRSDKVFLTPFGERMPYVELWPWLEQKLLGLGATGMTFSLDAAEEPTILTVPFEWQEPAAGPRAGKILLAVPICFEATVGSVCRRMVYGGGEKRADVLVNLSNDGWFGWSEAGRAQHAQMARLRCIENRVPMIRCANTGLSVAYDSAGNVIGTIGEGRYGTGQAPGALAVTLPLDRRTTLYSRVGDLWAWMCLAATCVLLALTWRRPGSEIGASG